MTKTPRLLRMLIGTLLAIALGASTLLAGGAAPASAAGCSTTLKSYPTVAKGAKGSAAKAAECALRAAGRTVKKNGYISSAEVGQIKSFQRAKGIKQSGKVDRATWTALISRGSQSTLKYNKRGSSVVRLQKALTASGRPVPATGWFGPTTRAAVKSFQRAAGLKASGVVGKGTWRALQTGKGAKKAATAAKKSTKAKKAVTVKGGSAKAKKAVSFAYAQLGDHYRYGGTGPSGWDCSGLTQGSWKSAGKKIPRTSQSQYSKYKKVSKSKLQPGDLVFFRSLGHVGIYVGNGYMIHSSRPGRPVSKVKLSQSGMSYTGAVRVA